MIIETSKAYGITVGRCKSRLFNLIKNTDTDSEAAFTLGMMYLKGLNVEQNTHKAMFYLNQARSLGHDKADITFAYLYKYGAPDLEKDPLEAAEFFRCAALFSKDGFKELAFVDEDALWEAFNLFLYGGESRKPLCVRSALSVLSDLREKRSPYALYLTGEIYHKGLYGETVDLEVAYKFYHEAAELGCKEAEEVLGEGYFYPSLYGK